MAAKPIILLDSRGDPIAAYSADLGAGPGAIQALALIDPNTGLPVSSSAPLPTQVSDVTVTGTLNAGYPAAGSTLTVVLGGRKTIGFTLSGTFNFRVRPFLSTDGGVTYGTSPLPMFDLNNSGGAQQTPMVSDAQGPGTFVVTAYGGGTHVQLQVVAYTSGSATATATATDVAQSISPATIWNSQTVNNLQPGLLVLGWDQQISVAYILPIRGSVLDTRPNAAGVIVRPFMPGDGTSTQALKAASTPAAAADPAAAVTQSPNSDLIYKAIDVAANGVNQIVAADATRKIKVVSWFIVPDGVVTAQWQDSTPTNLSGAMKLVASTPYGLAGQHNNRLFETAVNKDLQVNLSGAVGIRGHLAYRLEL